MPATCSGCGGKSLWRHESVPFALPPDRDALQKLERAAGNPHRLGAPHYLGWFASIDHREQLTYAAGATLIRRLTKCRAPGLGRYTGERGREDTRQQGRFRQLAARIVVGLA